MALWMGGQADRRRRGMYWALLPLVALVLASCGGARSSSFLTDVTATASPPAPTVTPLPATAIMVDLDMAGEPFSASGDPSAPITVVEFSDYG